MAAVNLQEFSIGELENVIVEAKALIETKRREMKELAIAEARAILEKAGVSPQELARSKPAKKLALNLKQGRKYLNPENRSEFWIAGKGRRPKWLSDLEARGVVPDEE